MDLNTEIRKVKPGDFYKLFQILDIDTSWKKLMAAIPNTLSSNSFECKIAYTNLPKYNTDHFQLIENASDRLQRYCSEILFEEWGTSGRVRPRLGHLLYLLEKTELYRAADYIAVDLLKLPSPKRPLTGPAAKINTSLEEILKYQKAQIETNSLPSSFLHEEPFSSSFIDRYINQIVPRVIPKIVIEMAPESEMNFNIVEARNMNIIQSESASLDNQGPAFSILLNSDSDNISESTNDRESKQMLIEENTSNIQTDSLSYLPNVGSSNFVPAISLLLNDNANNNDNIEGHVASVDEQNSEGSTNQTESSNLEYNISNNANNLMPALSVLLVDNENLETSDVINSNQASVISYPLPDFSNIMDKSNDSSQLPNLSLIMNKTDSREDNIIYNESFVDSSQIPNLSAIVNKTTDQITEDVISSPQIPNLSKIMNKCTEEILLNKEDLPAFSQILSDNNIPAMSQLLVDDVPHISALLQNTNIQRNESLILNNILSVPAQTSNSNQQSSRSCGSPLPNLSLNTVLPHYMYTELEQCTKNFNENMCSSMDNAAAFKGRKLGSGAFGSVYLGTGLLDIPIAVKKLNLNGVNIVNIDDTITKQFRNEVELLCKYKHENLLSLLGYSCDGPTYCLIYEYIPGGALKDRLQVSLKSPEESRLMWTDRFYIALGTAKAVAYLHTAYKGLPLIHRDVKSANILLDNSNKPKLCDFGLIKLTPNQNTNITTTVFGTSAYMAPEAFRGDVSVKVDTFSFGVVLLELLTSLPPLDENREGNDLITHVEEMCDNGIKPLLDVHAGSWQVGDIHFGDQLYIIAQKCLEEKKRRPDMTQVVSSLSELIHKASLST